MNASDITTSAASFSSKGSSLPVYVFCASGLACSSPCTAGFYFNFATESCVPCPSNSISSANEFICTCIAPLFGYIGQSRSTCNSPCPTGKKCVMIMNGGQIINLREVELYQGAAKISNSLISISISSTAGANPVTNCNDGVITTASNICHTNDPVNGDSNTWLMLATSETFTRVVVYNRDDCDVCKSRINSASLVFMAASDITTSAASFSSKGTSLITYVFCASGYNGILCDVCSTGYVPNRSGSILKCYIRNKSKIHRDFLFMDL